MFVTIYVTAVRQTGASCCLPHGPSLFYPEDGVSRTAHFHILEHFNLSEAMYKEGTKFWGKLS
jgi:hypothetical protein